MREWTPSTSSIAELEICLASHGWTPAATASARAAGWTSEEILQARLNYESAMLN